ncbi:TPA: hypothetical protein ACIAR4_004783, partial [Salmonella enterica subsp. enterica serovar Weltevreden]
RTTACDAALHCQKHTNHLIKLKLSFFLLSKKSSNCLLQLIDYQNVDFSFGEEFSSRFQFFHASTFNMMLLMATPNSEASTLVEVARRNTGTATRISSSILSV